MNWLAVLLALASLGGSPVPSHKSHKPKCSKTVTKHCTKAKPKKPSKKPVTKPKQPGASQPGAPQDDSRPSTQRSDPAATPTPTPTPKPGATPTPTPVATATPVPTATPVYPRRTAVDLVEWDIRSSYPTLAAGQVSFNANNLGEDDHNLSVRGGGREWGAIDLTSGERATLSLNLPAGDYTLYCSLLGHEDAGMKLGISVR